jgi:hypothetical protein
MMWPPQYAPAHYQSPSVRPFLRISAATRVRCLRRLTWSGIASRRSVWLFLTPHRCEALMDAMTVFQRALDCLSLKHPQRTALGVLLGVVLHGVSAFLNGTGALPQRAADALALYHFLAVGATVMHLPTIWANLHHTAEIDESIYEAFRAIEELRRRKGVTAVQAGAMYRDVVQHVLERTQLGADTQRRVEAVRRSATLAAPSDGGAPT